MPIVAYGHPVLKKVAEPIDKSFPDLADFINKMFESMYESDGVGLAAPQVNHSIRLFIIDTDPFKTNYPEAAGIKRVFINPKIVEESGESWYYNEGCLSVPGIHEDVLRKSELTMQYQDIDFVEHTEKFSGIVARVIQHEYDHLEGILFPDRLPSLRRRLLKRKLEDISKGKVDVDYRMIFPTIKK